MGDTDGYDNDVSGLIGGEGGEIRIAGSIQSLNIISIDISQRRPLRRETHTGYKRDDNQRHDELMAVEFVMKP